MPLIVFRDASLRASDTHVPTYDSKGLNEYWELQGRFTFKRNVPSLSKFLEIVLVLMNEYFIDACRLKG